MSSSNSSITTTVAFIMIGLGVLFLASMIFGFNFWNLVWPAFVIAPSVPFLYFAYTGGRDLSWLAIPGHLIAGTGIMLLYQSATGHWESWAYSWTLYAVFLGTALDYAGQQNEEGEVVAVGKWFTWIGLVLFVGLGIIFELVIFGGWVRRIVLAAILIGIGAWLLARDGSLDFDIRLPSKPKNKPKRKPYMPPSDEPLVMSSRKSRLEVEIDEALGRVGDTPKPQNGSDSPAEA